MKISLSLLSPTGLYLALNLSKRWKVLRSCMKKRKNRYSGNTNSAPELSTWISYSQHEHPTCPHSDHKMTDSSSETPVNGKISIFTNCKRWDSSSECLTCERDISFPSLFLHTMSLGRCLTLLLMKRSRCFWFMQEEAWTWVSTWTNRKHEDVHE